MKKIELTDDGNLQNYIRVEFTRNANGILEMKKEFLIKIIIEMLDLPDMNSVMIQNIKPSIFADNEIPIRKQKWNHRSLIGMLNYLDKTSRPDLEFALHQEACFSINPIFIHEQAVRRIMK